MRLKSYLYALMAMLALWAMVVAVSPAIAQARERTPTKDTKAYNPQVTRHLRYVRTSPRWGAVAWNRRLRRRFFSTKRGRP